MSITIFATVEAKSDVSNAVEAALRAMIEPTRAEPGCLHYALFASQEAAGTFHLLETYADDAALAAHHASAHFAALVESIGDKLAREIRIERISALES
ncbi:putative quinol monooxygenase [Uliginosibacterium sp. 31-12]|uniref:putative quinol monooxygenase n=1 Tax=Uliginosibacterium sp. 31-12 TaxID=3062781 RepID=UPI0026E27E75|nr:antibiotic biosynthesis monooxygenase [Uliginosibacterium sp. 31-12]MDO6387727.1 antibiotic biosynthesis monooxygenase [Uliginosibacterium sp. 31-12]